MAFDEIVGDAIDRLVAIEMRFGAGLPRGVIHPLFEAARKHHGKPLSWLAATKLKERVQKGRNVFVVTGAGFPPGLPQGETDGPMGAAAVARAIDLALGGKPILLSEDRHLPAVIKATEAAGIACLDEKVFRQRGGVALALPFPLGPEAGRDAAKELIERWNPAAIVFVEKVGPNEKGFFHSINGSMRPLEHMANAHLLAERAKEKGILTIGIGDGGNEIGCGAIAAAVREVQPYGRKCQCPCGGGIGTVTATDVLIFASISNWGAYGLAAALAAQAGRVDVMQDEAAERRMLEACLAGGAMDGAYARLIPYVDGTSAEVQTSLVTMLRQIVTNALTSYDRGF
jgi:hypothetical protein